MDPLAQLQDIQLPDKINSYPIAIGWWLLAIICIGLILFITIKMLKRKKLHRAQQQALSQLALNNPTSEHCVSSLKWAALQYFPRERIANLYGESFHHFLIDALPNKYQEKFKTLSRDTLQNIYKKPVDVDTNADTRSDVDEDGHLSNKSNNSDDFYQASLLWLKHALPPKPKSKTKSESKPKAEQKVESTNTPSNNLSESK